MLGRYVAWVILSSGLDGTIADCPAELHSLLHERACVMSSDGIVVADDLFRATNLARWAQDGRDRTKAALALDLVPYIVVDGEAGEAAGNLVDAAKALGYTAVLNWLSPAAVQRQLEEGVARTVREQMATAGIEGPRLDQIVAGAVAQVAAQSDPDAVAQRDSVVVPHELAHKWLEAALWPTAPRRPGQYGGPIPDWADEMVAIAAEPEHSLQARKEFFRREHRDALAGGISSPFADLAGFLSSDHPMATEMGTPTGKTGYTVRILETGGTASKGMNPAHYYSQALLLYDLLTENGLDRLTFAHLLTALEQGITFGDWLEQEGARAGLPGSIAALESLWRDRLDQESRD